MAGGTHPLVQDADDLDFVVLNAVVQNVALDTNRAIARGEMVAPRSHLRMIAEPDQARSRVA